MANHYYDMTGVLRLKAVTPVIQALFGAFDLDETFPGEEGEAFVANISESTVCSWEAVATYVGNLVRSLCPDASCDELCDICAMTDLGCQLAVLAKHFGVAEHHEYLAIARTFEADSFDECEDADLEMLFKLACLFNDGHGLSVLKTSGAWHTDRVKSFGFGGDGLFAGLKASGYLSSAKTLSLTESLDTRLHEGKEDDAAELLFKHVETLLNGIHDADQRERVRSRLAAKLNPASVPVKHWDAYQVPDTVMTHQFDIEDQRKQNGQAFITVGALEGNPDDLLSVTMEVNTHPLNGLEHLPCIHVHFDGDNMAVSLFKVGDRILMRPETMVRCNGFTHDFGTHKEEFFWIE